MRETLRMTRAAGHPRQGLPDDRPPDRGRWTASTRPSQFLRAVELDLCQVTKFTPYPGTPSYPTIREHGTFDEDWERMNAMNFVFVPNGLTRGDPRDLLPPPLPIFYSRPDVLRGIARMVVEEPRFLRQLGSSAWVYLKSQLPDRRFRRALFGRRPAQPSLAS